MAVKITTWLSKKWKEYIRVLKLLKTPTREEIVAAIKISGGGILLVGLISYIVKLVFSLFL
ncbi:MAG: protein translocase SEC61 complex subunit gamma [Candidatus Nanohaloarchaeota archaeon]|nr:protein translocase SEC61 complex subunit gamma [Candidatus Nanohaloarchaeota archaeon]